MIGTYIVTRRMVFISGGITHACFGGLGLGYFLGVNPIMMAAVFAVAGSLGVDWLAKRNARKDTAIAVIWAFGMALGTMFIFMTDGYVPELNSFLFGNVLTITVSDIVVFAIFTLLLGMFYCIMYKRIVAISFDPDFAKVNHLPVTFINTVMTVFVAVAIVLTIRMIGIMLLMSLLSLPQMTAELFTQRYSRLALGSTIISLAGCVGGLLLSYAISVPASATIVLLLAVIYTLSIIYKQLFYNK
jgi:zinc transport system permease protein